jgi:D-glycero-D-manno-heptose 1,7-bisphosphate phosphatase
VNEELARSLALDGPPLLFVDLDGTVRHGKDELGRFVNGPADVVVFPEAIVMMRRWRDLGGRVFGVTNQAGVALGHMTADQCEAAIGETVEQARDEQCGPDDYLIDHVVYCPHAPDAGCFCRKPQPGLLLQLVRSTTRQLGAPARDRCLMVGDREEDRLAAAAAGVPFEWAATWRARAAA